VGALSFNTTGFDNTANGADALGTNFTGHNNTASGFEALLKNTEGSDNAAFGNDALSSNTTGTFNTASGFQALMKNIDGSRNIAVGVNAGVHLISGDLNIYLGNTGQTSESNTMRLGQVQAQTRTFIAGVAGVPISGASVTINSGGQLGILASSARYKHDIRNM